MFYVYILYSASIDRFYIGHSENPWERVEQHNDNTSEKFTGVAKDWELRAVFEVGKTRGEAIKMETFIKKQKSRKLIQRLVDCNFVPAGKLSQLVRVAHERE